MLIYFHNNNLKKLAKRRGFIFIFEAILGAEVTRRLPEKIKIIPDEIWRMSFSLLKNNNTNCNFLRRQNAKKNLETL